MQNKKIQNFLSRNKEQNEKKGAKLNMIYCRDEYGNLIEVTTEGLNNEIIVETIKLEGQKLE